MRSILFVMALLFFVVAPAVLVAFGLISGRIKVADDCGTPFQLAIDDCPKKAGP